MHIFISYASSQVQTAEHVATYLERHGVKAWYAARDIRPGTTWSQSIPEAITSSRALLVLFSAEADASPQINRELVLADKANRPIFWLRLEDIEPLQLSYFLSANQWFDWLDRRDSALESLAGSFTSEAPPAPQKRPRPTSTAVAEKNDIAHADGWPLGIIALDTESDAAEAAAHLILASCRQRDGGTLILPTGGAATKLFKAIRRIASNYGPRPFGYAQITNDTETFGVHANHSTSRSRHVLESLIDPLRKSGFEIDEDCVHLLSGIFSEEDPLERSRRLLRVEPPFLHAVSISPTGETLAYEVGTTHDADDIINDQARIVEVGESGRKYIDPNQPSRSIMTIGMGSCLSSETLVILAYDHQKSRIVSQMVRNNENPGIPATLLRRHARCIIITTAELVNRASLESFTKLDCPADIIGWLEEQTRDN